MYYTSITILPYQKSPTDTMTLYVIEMVESIEFYSFSPLLIHYDHQEQIYFLVMVIVVVAASVIGDGDLTYSRYIKIHLIHI